MLEKRATTFLFSLALLVCVGFLAFSFGGRSRAKHASPSADAALVRAIEQLALGNAELRDAVEALTARLESGASEQLALPSAASRAPAGANNSADIAALVGGRNSKARLSAGGALARRGERCVQGAERATRVPSASAAAGMECVREGARYILPARELLAVVSHQW